MYLKHVIQREYRNDKHYVWCSEHFDARTAGGPYTPAGLIPASSNPADIYRALKADCEGRDRHSSKIAEQKASLVKLATHWEKSGEIAADDRDEILFMVQNADFNEWRPIIYVIPRQPVEARLQIVPMSKRAGFGPEYIIPDLDRTEFDLIEV